VVSVQVVERDIVESYVAPFDRHRLASEQSLHDIKCLLEHRQGAGDGGVHLSHPVLDAMAEPCMKTTWRYLGQRRYLHRSHRCVASHNRHDSDTHGDGRCHRERRSRQTDACGVEAVFDQPELVESSGLGSLCALDHRGSWFVAMETKPIGSTRHGATVGQIAPRTEGPPLTHTRCT
jgi:hypothetical protein